ncbi:class I SAM-dependent methyltransferase [Winogradskyella bathintestinalis]|uniref:Class I SAM-dependent methyltransferase n=1 Tax=Winogradskyella bathintestinalis TaxID=3035208 RepID=A0ABT7ZT72_9FLAO|nr:class I SAM-dependent methyltransferase [Winogradskyella bathintestinalis]MDN3492172.1 class I SAM-dependent methyltransferase [Winogradskyella bathintestinalis]
MNYEESYKTFGNIDIYVIDQILKERYVNGQSILDAGCGGGRNLKWFYSNDFDLYSIDSDVISIANAKQLYPKAASNFTVGHLDNLPYNQARFDHIICCAVLHFAESEMHFKTMFTELVRVLKPRGTLLIRMASNIGLDGNAPEITNKENGKKGTYYLTRERITSLLLEFELKLLEPVKTTNVQDERAMTTLVFQKLILS